MCGEQAYGAAPDPTISKRVGGDSLGDQSVEEAGHAGVAALLLGASSHLKEGTDGIKIAMGKPR